MMKDKTTSIFQCLDNDNYFHIHIVTLKNHTGCTFELQKVFHKNKKPPNLVATSDCQFQLLAGSGSNSWFGY
jgi:hypothetical protein